MDATTIAVGLASALGDFTAAFGPIVLTIVGAALGLYGVRLVYGLVTNFIRARQAAR
jgi:hypothetical protein